MDWYSHTYDYNSKDTFAYLIQFADGNRIDLTIVDLCNIQKETSIEPRIILLNKDNYQELIPVDNENTFYIQPPTEMEFYNTSNEFRWLSVYISKGLCRDEFYYAKYSYDVLIMKMFIKMLNWAIGIRNDFEVTTGAHSKYLKRFLSLEEMIRVRGIFPNGNYEDIWDKLFLMYDYFDELETEVAEHFNFNCDKEETKRVREFLIQRMQNRPTN
jgi:aminoglycoside 6-adenylyltransferase